MNPITDTTLFAFFSVVIWLALLHVFPVDVHSSSVNHPSHLYGNLLWCLSSKGCEATWEDMYKIQ